MEEINGYFLRRVSDFPAICQLVSKEHCGPTKTDPLPFRTWYTRNGAYPSTPAAVSLLSVLSSTTRKETRTMLKEILTAALAIVAAWLLIALLPSLFEVGIGLMLLAGLFWLASVISAGFKPCYREA